MKKLVYILIALSCLFFCACHFNYGEEETEAYTFPEMTFENLEYIRMRDSKMSARLSADEANRYEKKHLMELKNYSFEQFDTSSEAIDSTGEGGKAAFDLSNNNVQMEEGVHIKVDSEDFTLRADNLTWQDKEKTLSSEKSSKIHITRSDGTEINGTGFHSNLRDRSWVFDSPVDGTYNLEDEEKDDTEEKKE